MNASTNSFYIKHERVTGIGGLNVEPHEKRGGIKVYLDTSVISALFDTTNPERRSLTKAFFQIASGFDVYISEITTVEIERTPDSDLREKMRKVASKFPVLTLSDEVEQLAIEYIRHGAVPERYAEDAYHIAVAVVNGMDYLLSWNYRHLVRKKTRDTVSFVNTLYRLKHIQIMAPAELL